MTKPIFLVGDDAVFAEYEDIGHQTTMSMLWYRNTSSALADLLSSHAIITTDLGFAYDIKDVPRQHRRHVYLISDDSVTSYERHNQAITEAHPLNLTRDQQAGLLRKVLSPQPIALVMDDDDMIRRLMPRIFEQRGFQTLAAKDSDEALVHVPAAHLVLSDVEQPTGNGGYGLLEQTRSMYHPDQLPFALMSGMPINETYATLATAAFQKPIATEQLEQFSDEHKPTRYQPHILVVNKHDKPLQPSQPHTKYDTLEHAKPEELRDAKMLILGYCDVKAELDYAREHRFSGRAVIFTDDPLAKKYAPQWNTDIASTMHDLDSIINDTI